MGAIDPTSSINLVGKMKSISLETGGKSFSAARCPSINLSEINTDKGPPSPYLGKKHLSVDDQSRNLSASNSILFGTDHTSHGSALKPSASTSCLLSTDDDKSDDNNTSAFVCIPTRASLTHEWKKLKTPNKCRECNLLVYFNGRECSFCGFVAHKKCVTVLVIKCSGQNVDRSSSKTKQRNKQLQRQQMLQQSDRPCDAKQQNCLNNQIWSQQLTSRKQLKQTNSIRPIFGQPIDVDGEHVLDFAARFIYEIDTRGLSFKGIYRVSSIKSKVDKLCNYYDQNLTSLIDLSSFHPNIIANALKLYLRQLPEPLLTNKLYRKFIDIAKKCDCKFKQTSKLANQPMHNSPTTLACGKTSLETQATVQLPRSSGSSNDPNYDPALIAEFSEIIQELPAINRKLVAIIMRHLKRVATMSSENQMDARNLSIIFGPTLLSANNESLAIVDNVHQARVVELMITWADHIFPQYSNYESKAVIELNSKFSGGEGK